MFGAAIVAKTSRMVATKITSSKAYPCCPAFRRANPRLAVIMANLQPAPREAPWRCVRTRDTRRRSLYRAKRIAAGTLVFRLAGTCDLIHANLRVVDAEHGVVVLDGGICNNCARLAVEIP